MQNTGIPAIDCQGLVGLIQTGDPGVKQTLYVRFERGLRFLANRECSQHADDCVHETIDKVIIQVQAGKLESSDQLLRLMRNVFKCVVAAKREYLTPLGTDQSRLNNVEELDISEAKQKSMRAAVRRLTAREREIVTRIYGEEQDQEHAAREMGLTIEDFQRQKSLVRQKLGIESYLVPACSTLEAKDARSVGVNHR